MANITFTLRRPLSSGSSAPTNVQSSVTTSIPVNMFVSSLGMNASARRKVQNRLNQRARRGRQATDKSNSVQNVDLFPPPLLKSGNVETAAQQDPPLLGQGSNDPTNFNASLPISDVREVVPARLHPYALPEHHYLGISGLAPHTSWCKPLESFITEHKIADIQDTDAASVAHEDSATTSFEKSFLKNLNPADLHRLPGDDHLLSLMYYNVFRALASNSRILGLDTYAMHADDYPSPFITGSAYNCPVPPHLQPTLLQRTVAHHPCFDIFPDPVVRDRGIANTHLMPHGKLCMTLAGRNTWFENDRSKRSGLVVWGPPEDANSWEVTEGFLEAWRWLIQGSFVLQYSTNRWRVARGEPPILFA